MQHLNKKGMAEIVQIMSIIVLSIVAIGTVWGYVSDLGNTLNNQLSPVVDCLSQTSGVISACKNTQGIIEARVNLVSADSINLVQFSLGQETFTCGTLSCNTCNLKEGVQVVYFTPNNPSQENTNLLVRFNGCSNTLSAQVGVC